MRIKKFLIGWLILLFFLSIFGFLSQKENLKKFFGATLVDKIGVGDKIRKIEPVPKPILPPEPIPKPIPEPPFPPLPTPCDNAQKFFPLIGAVYLPELGHYIPGLGIIKDLPWEENIPEVLAHCENLPEGGYRLYDFSLPGLGILPTSTLAGFNQTSCSWDERCVYLPGIGLGYLPEGAGFKIYLKDSEVSFEPKPGYTPLFIVGVFIPKRGYYIHKLGILPERGLELVGPERYLPGKDYYQPSYEIEYPEDYPSGIDKSYRKIKNYRFYKRKADYCQYKYSDKIPLDLDGDNYHDCLEDLCPDLKNLENSDRDGDLLGDVCDVSTNIYINDLTTDFFEIRDWQVPHQIKIGLPNLAKIEYKEPLSNLAGLNLDEIIKIGHNLVSVDSERAPQLNKPAIITLYNLNFLRPAILRNGEPCPENICQIIDYSQGNLSFEINQFTSYSAQETAVFPLSWPGSFLPPTPPKGGFSVLINNGAKKTFKREVILKLNGGPDAKKMVISENANFSGASQENYQEIKHFLLSEGEGKKIIYVKFFSQYGQPSPIVSSSIIYEKPVLEKIREIFREIEEFVKKLERLLKI